VPDVLRLIPQPGGRLPIRGLLLDHDLRSTVGPAETLVYTAFVVSVDGRIAVDAQGDGDLSVPATLANERDWRLFQELVAQADAVIVSGRYVRERGEGSGQSVFDYLEDEGHADLVSWRRTQHLPERPVLVIVSNSLDFDPGVALTMSDRVIVVTAGTTPVGAGRRLESNGLDVVRGGATNVTGEELVATLAERGHRIVFSAAGPEVFHTLVTGNALDLVFATQVQRLLGGERYASMLEHDLPDTPCDVLIEAMYLDEHHPGPGGQLITRYRVVSRSTATAVEAI
jgi:riboflavin biosynthesis pyrimidine reductase